ncbi:hypothetical protein [Mesoplasma entomophilum]|uniref:hypothetical protein n=1 Tax=Mesoplasma entomophilum TaxID=2149 RepID=UPI0013E0D4DC|nr:hypothetical protein [Mesoplasma entomophilum]
MRNPSLNTYEVYGKNLSGKKFGIKTNNPEVIAETNGEVKVKNNKQFLTIKVSSTAKDDMTSIITLYQEDDPNQKIEIQAKVWALPYLVETSNNWPKEQLKIKKDETVELRFIIKNYKNSSIDKIQLFKDDTDYEYFKMSLETVDESKGEFIWKITGNVKHWFWGSTNISLKIKSENSDWQTLKLINQKTV